MSVRLGLLGLSVAAAALLAVTAGAAEVKGPVHITNRGVEFISAVEWENGESTADSRRDAAREASAMAREAIAEGRMAAREAERERSEAAREAQNEAREAAAEARREATEAARETREAAMESARDMRDAAREIAREARAHARVAIRFAMRDLPVLTAGVRVEIHKALEDVSDARYDVVQAALQLADVKAGDFTDIVMISKGEMKCGDVAAHDVCSPLTEADKALLVKELDAAMQSAAQAIEAAQAGLAAAPRAEADEVTP